MKAFPRSLLYKGGVPPYKGTRADGQPIDEGDIKEGP